MKPSSSLKLKIFKIPRTGGSLLLNFFQIPKTSGYYKNEIPAPPLVEPGTFASFKSGPPTAPIWVYTNFQISILMQPNRLSSTGRCSQNTNNPLFLGTINP
jgi:hypothetical protein